MLAERDQREKNIEKNITIAINIALGMLLISSIGILTINISEYFGLGFYFMEIYFMTMLLFGIVIFLAMFIYSMMKYIVSLFNKGEK